ncbi:ninjurin-B-like [Anopheles maculipalpis]|uniref:ninjurin-B-like n=1 Tax=Anopheles maculipalpis TaxID=1496333 RepID=UPI002158C2FD|nr:ninjurin-B-like [Anopheles maculipalpis]
MSELVSYRSGMLPAKVEVPNDEDLNGDDNDFSSIVESEHGEHNNYPCARSNAGYTSLMVYQESKPYPAQEKHGQESIQIQRQDSDITDLKEPTNKQLNAELSSFVQKKSFAQNMMDIALLSANTNQLRYVIDLGDKHPYYMTSLLLIIVSLVMQIVVGLSMVYLNRYNMKNKREMKAASHMNNLSVAGVFLVTLVNVFISTFNGAGVGPMSTQDQASVPQNASTLTTQQAPFVEQENP